MRVQICHYLFSVADVASQSKLAAGSSQVHAAPVLKSKYKKGEAVLAKWTDCKLYTATVLNKVGKGWWWFAIKTFRCDVA